jgi:hypothetical protein
MSTPILICAGIAVLFLIFELAQIVSRLYDIHIDLCHIHEDLVRFYARGQLESKPGKQREYWRDQNGFKHWRKVKDA